MNSSITFILIRRILPFCLILCSATGCRLGNRIEFAKKADKTSGFYIAQPQSMQVFVTTTSTLNKSVSLDSIPSEINKLLTNPVELAMQDLESGSGKWISLDGNHTLSVNIQPDQSIWLNGSTKKQTYWVDPDCQSYLKIQQKGQLHQTSNLPEIPGNTHALLGQIELSLTVATLFEGDCRATFSDLKDCYLDVEKCGGADTAENEHFQGILKSVFQPYIDSGALTTDEIDIIQNYGYEIIYN